VTLITAKDFYLLSVVSLIQTADWFSSLKLRALLANTLAFIGYHLSRNKRRLSERNLSNVFGGKLSTDRIRTIVKSSFHQFWQETFSMPCPNVSKVVLEQLNIRGLEHLQSAIDNGKGAILWASSYFGGSLLAKRILHQNGFAVHQVHAESHIGAFQFPEGRSPPSWLHRRVIKRFFEKCEKQFVAEILYLPLARSDSLAFTRVLAGRLKQNAILCLAADGRFGQNLMAAKFLGHAGSFQTGVISLAKFSGAPILPLFCFQDEGKISVVIEPPLRIHSGLGRERALEKSLLHLVNLLESYIRKYPEQYRNWHYPWGRPQETM